MNSLRYYLRLVCLFLSLFSLSSFEDGAWAQLINHHIDRGEYHIALFEAEKMMKEAEKKGSAEGIADCYTYMANIYAAQKNPEKAVEFIQKVIDLFEYHKNLPIGDISVRYSDAARYYIELGQREKAPALLVKAENQAKTNYHRALAKLAYVQLYLAGENVDLAHKTLKECEALYETDTTLQRYKEQLYETELAYYRHTRENTRALDAIQRRIEWLAEKGESRTLSPMIRSQADIYWEMGEKEKAAELYQLYLSVLSDEKQQNEEITIAEYATLLDLQKINEEKNELQIVSQKKALQNTRIVVFFLVFLLILIVFFFYRQRRLNLQLKRSEEELIEKNRVLEAAEKELRIAKEIAEESNRMKTVFIQHMSHEIRTPLNSIVGFSTVLANMFAEEDEDVRSYAGILEENSQILLELMNGILEISLLDGSERGFILSPIDINACCEESVRAVKATMKVAEGVELIFRSKCRNLTTESNFEKLSLALTNILHNAVKYTGQGEIVLSCEVENNTIHLSITDTGIGIPVEKQERIFERFVKLDTFAQGIGLGLSTSRLIAERLGGSLILDKDYTRGCRFILSIPLT